MLDGEVVYCQADKLYTMGPDDSLSFDAHAPTARRSCKTARALPVRDLLRKGER